MGYLEQWRIRKFVYLSDCFTGKERSEGASSNAPVICRKMCGAKGDTRTNFGQEFMNTTETTGRAGDPSTDLTPTHSTGKL